MPVLPWDRGLNLRPSGHDLVTVPRIPVINCSRSIEYYIAFSILFLLFIRRRQNGSVFLLKIFGHYAHFLFLNPIRQLLQPEIIGRTVFFPQKGLYCIKKSHREFIILNWVCIHTISNKNNNNNKKNWTSKCLGQKHVYTIFEVRFPGKSNKVTFKVSLRYRTRRAFHSVSWS